jgi:hypothetical protein
MNTEFSVQIGTGLKYMQFFSLKFNFFAPFATCCWQFSGGKNSMPSSVVVSIYKIYLHSIAQYFIPLCMQKFSVNHARLFINIRISIRCYLNFIEKKNRQKFIVQLCDYVFSSTRTAEGTFLKSLAA